MTQAQHHARSKQQIVFWDGKVGTTPPRLRADAVELLCFGAGSSLEQLRKAAREALEMYPWATVVVANRWVPLFVNLAVENLHLCLGTAFLYRPAEKVRMGRESYSLPLSPLAFRSVVISEGEPGVIQHIDAWKSLHIQDPGAFLNSLSDDTAPSPTSIVDTRSSEGAPLKLGFGHWTKVPDTRH